MDSTSNISGLLFLAAFFVAKNVAKIVINNCYKYQIIVYICSTNANKMTNNLTLHSNQIDHTISIIKGFEVDYNSDVPNKDYNNQGTWGKIVNRGETVLSVTWNPNKGEPNFGRTDYQVQLDYMKRQLLILSELQPKQLLSFIIG